MNPAASFCEAFPRSIPFDNATLNSRITLGSWLVCAVTLFAAFLERTWSHVNYQRAPPENDVRPSSARFECGRARCGSNEILLAHVIKHMREEFSRVPNYTCLETTDRFYRFLGRQKKNRILPLDAVRLEIVYRDHEWYAASGDKNSARPIG